MINVEARLVVTWSDADTKPYRDVIPLYAFHPEWLGGRLVHEVHGPAGQTWPIICQVEKREDAVDLVYGPTDINPALWNAGTSHFRVRKGQPLPEVDWSDAAGRSTAAGMVELEPYRTRRDDPVLTAVGRRKQAAFKARVCAYWDNQCALTGIDFEPLLIASHIKGYRDPETTASEREDADNGLLLERRVDALFDRGLVSFDDNGVLLVGPAADSLCRALRIEGTLRKPLTPGHKRNLRAHRRRHGFKEGPP